MFERADDFTDYSLYLNLYSPPPFILIVHVCFVLVIGDLVPLSVCVLEMVLILFGF